ncbi:MAG: ABC transporter substrate-binding protein [Nitrospirota bacterium]|nr:ABC transporter substrate-binding protein [Nitrospirota bacterium]
MVAALGLADHLVGISHECDFPPAIRNTPVMIRAMINQEQMASPDIDRAVTRAASEHQSLYTLDDAMFSHAEPDLVITQDLCHVCAITPSQLDRAIDSLPRPPRVLTLNAASLEEVFIDIEQIGEATNKISASRTLTSGLRTRLQAVRKQVAFDQTLPTVVCVEWLDPLYAAGHWIPEMASWAGGRHLLGKTGAPSERITWEQLVAAAPDVLIVMPCGFSIERTVREMNRLTAHPDWHRLPAVQQGRVFAVDSGAYFSRPGPRLVDGTEILAALCHPSRFGQTTPAGARRIVNEPVISQTDTDR